MQLALGVSLYLLLHLITVLVHNIYAFTYIPLIRLTICCLVSNALKTCFDLKDTLRYIQIFIPDYSKDKRCVFKLHCLLFRIKNLRNIRRLS